MKYVLIFCLMLCTAPDIYEGVRDTCDKQLDDCLKMCKESPEPDCELECRQEWDFCMRLP